MNARILVFAAVAVSLAAAPADAGCGCEAGNLPCEQETLAVPVAATAIGRQHVSFDGMELSMTHCWGCNSGGDMVIWWMLGMLVTPLLIVGLRIARGPMIVMRLDRLSAARTSPVDVRAVEALRVDSSDDCAITRAPPCAPRNKLRSLRPASC